MGITASQSPNNSTYLPVGFQADRHPAVLERFEELRKRPIASLEELKNWLLDRGTLNAFLSERFAELFVAFSRDTGNDKKMNAYQEFVQDISPLVAEMDQKLSIKLNASSSPGSFPPAPTAFTCATCATACASTARPTYVWQRKYRYAARITAACSEP